MCIRDSCRNCPKESSGLALRKSRELGRKNNYDFKSTLGKIKDQEKKKSKETKTSNPRRKSQRYKGKSIAIQKRQNNFVKTRAAESKFGHCDYVDLVEVGYREGSNCGPGGKFLFKVIFLFFLDAIASLVVTPSVSQ